MYSSILIGNLWADSVALRWEGFKREGETLRFTGKSRRFPYSLTYALGPMKDGIEVSLTLIADDELGGSGVSTVSSARVHVY